MTLALHGKSSRRRGLLAIIAVFTVAIAVFSAATLKNELSVSADPQDTVVWFSQFGPGPANDIPDWADEAVSADEQMTGGYARLRNATNIFRAGNMADLVDTHLEYDWGFDTDADGDPGSLIVEWRPVTTPESAYIVLNTHAFTADTTQAPTPAHVDIPDADGLNIQIRFRTTSTGTIDEARVDNIRLSGNPDLPPDADGDGVPDVDDICEDSVNGVDEDGCSLDQYIDMLDDGTANGGLSENVCAAANFSLVVDRSGSVSTSELTTVKSEINQFISTYDATGNGLYEVTSFSTSGAYPRTGIGYEDSGNAIVTVNAIAAPSGETNTADGIGDGNHLAGNSADDIMFVITDGSPNLPNAAGLLGDDPFRWVTAANQAIAAANAARSTGFVVEAIFIPSIDNDLANAFGSSQAGAEFAAAVMAKIGGGGYTSLGNFSSIAETLLASTGCAPVFRDVTVEKSVEGDTPPAPLTSVSGTISGHTPGTWTISTVPGSTTIEDVSSLAHTVTETSPGAGWTVEYGVAASTAAPCSSVTWSTTPAVVPASESHAKVCIRNTFDEVTRTIFIDKLVTGDTPTEPLTGVTGTITNHTPGIWNISPVPGGTSVTASTASHTVTEDSPGDGWIVQYALAPSSSATCMGALSWSTTPVVVPAGSTNQRVCVRNTFVEADRTITIEKELGGDPTVLASVSGTISNHSPGNWSITPVPGSTDITDVSIGSHLITENSPGAAWTVEYGIADSPTASCDSVDSWQTEPILVPAGEDDVKVCILNSFAAEIPTRNVIIQKVLGGDPAALASVSGTISGHSPSGWGISPVPGTTTIPGVSVGAHTVTETPLAGAWMVEYAVADSSTAPCTGVDWSSTPATVPAGEQDVKVCIRNSFTAEPSLEKVGVAYDVDLGQARWDITIINPSVFGQTVTIIDPIAVNIVGGTPDGCSGNLAGGLTCEVPAESELTFTVFKMVTQQCNDQTVVNTASAFVDGDNPIEGSPQTDVETTIPGNPEFCEDLVISKAAVGWFSGMAGWAITIDNSETGLSQTVILNDPGAVAEGDYPQCGLADGDPIVDVECSLEVGEVLVVFVETPAPSDACEPRIVENILTASSTRGEPEEAVVIELEYEIFAVMTVPGNDELCPATVTVQKYIDADGELADLINGPQAGDTRANGWEITLTCDEVTITGTTGSGGDGTVVFQDLEMPLTDCTVSEELLDGYSGVGYYLDDDGVLTSGGQTAGIAIEIGGSDDDLVILFNEDDDQSTVAPTEPATNTPTGTNTATGTPTGILSGTPVGGTPVAPDSGSGFLDGSKGAANILFVVAGLLVVAGGASLFAISRRER